MKATYLHVPPEAASACGGVTAGVAPAPGKLSGHSAPCKGGRLLLALCLASVCGLGVWLCKSRGSVPLEGDAHGSVDLSAQGTSGGGPFLVFIKTYQMSPTVHHTAVVVCRREALPAQIGPRLEALAAEAAEGGRYDPVPKDLWANSQGVADCEHIEYGQPGDTSTAPGAGVMYHVRYLRSHVAFQGRHFDTVELYLFGQSAHSAGDVRQLYVEQQFSWIGKYWAGVDFDIYYMNCNTFTTQVLACAYGFQVQPRPGDTWWVDLVTPSCSTGFWGTQ